MSVKAPKRFLNDFFRKKFRLKYKNIGIPAAKMMQKVIYPIAKAEFMLSHQV